MAYVLGAATIASGGGVAPLFVVPPSLCNVTFWNNTTGTLYIGTSTAVTVNNALQCHSIPTSFFSYASSGPATFYGTVASGTAVINYIISTDQR